MAHWDRKFFESTRGRIVTMLRRTGRTVDELASELGLTGNGVRAHLATLERDGLVRHGGYVRRGGSGKPAHAYELTPEARGLFPKGYEPVLGGLLDILAERAGSEETVALLKETGARMAAGHESPSGDVRERLRAVVRVLDGLGGFAEIEENEGVFVIHGYGCPLAALAEQHPQVCGLVEALIAELAAVRVRERCERGEDPRCCFEVRPADGVGRG
ncbi:MAG TPA: helix-turn-helix domain-containing protein [Rubrobacteraceae bacterium]|nr:helix-turn-helix domain-containing protein [Rubrobacteraceae bacterium]